MADSSKVTIRQVYDAILEVKQQLQTMNGTVRQHSVDIAVLQERQEGDKGNWSRVWGILQPLLVALITATVIKAVP